MYGKDFAMKTPTTSLTLLLALSVQAPALAGPGPQYIPGVPDWNQPFMSGAPGGVAGPWSAWCVPTATANLVGFADDHRNFASIGDHQLYPASNAWTAVDFNDESADGSGGPRNDLGWRLDTNGARTGLPHTGTHLGDLKAGIEKFWLNHALPESYIRNYGVPTPFMPSWIYCDFDTTLNLYPEHNLIEAFNEVRREIDAGRPLLGHWGHGNLINTGQFPLPPGDQNIPDAEFYRTADWGFDPTQGGQFPAQDESSGEIWDAAQGLGHTMTIVGYWLASDPTNPLVPPVDAVIVFDNRDLPLNQRIPIILPWYTSPLAGVTSVAPASLIFVDDSGPAAGDGSSWPNAYPDLQLALADASARLPAAVEIWVAEGTYTPAPPHGSRFETFLLQSGVAIYGGFNATETERAQRNHFLQKSILSGDLNHDDPFPPCSADITPPGGNGVVNIDDLVALLNAFGPCPVPPASCPADIMPPGGNSAVNIDDLVALLNAFGACPTIGNAENSYHVVTGSAADLTAVLDGVTVTAGYANNNSGDANRGAGMLIVTSGGPTVAHSTFIENRSVWAGAAIYIRDTNPVMHNDRFLGNTAVGWGGAVRIWRSQSLLVNCLFSGNVLTSGNGGGAVGIEDTPSPTLRNCTFSNNNASATSHGGGGIISYSSSPVITNAVFWNNLDATGTTENAQLKNMFGTPLVNYSCIQGLTGMLGGVGNLGGDPLFIDPLGPDLIAGTLDDNLKPQSGSPIIDSGDNNSIPCSVSTDLDGGPRIINAVEMGAYEVQSVPPGN